MDSSVESKGEEGGGGEFGGFGVGNEPLKFTDSTLKSLFIF